jgi:N-acetylneuraminate lyase
MSVLEATYHQVAFGKGVVVENMSKKEAGFVTMGKVGEKTLAMIAEEAKFEGIYPALITPFDQEGEVVFKHLKDVLHFQLEKGVHGFFVCGSTGEGPLMSIEQRKTVAETVIEEVGSKVPVIVHVGTINTRETIELAKHASKAGATAISLVSPYYFKPDIDELMDHYRLVSKEVTIPVFAYNIPEMTGFNITPAMFKRLCSIQNVIGIKDSSGNLSQTRAMIETAPKPVVVINGYDGLFFASLMIGAKAQVSGPANVAPELYVELYELYRRGRYQEALDVQTRINAIIRAIYESPIVGPPIASLKKALELRGVKAGLPMRPLRPLKEEEISGLRKRLEELKLFW